MDRTDSDAGGIAVGCWYDQPTWTPALVLEYGSTGLVSVSHSAGAWLEWVPLALLVDLAFLGAGEQVGVSPLQGFAAIIAVALVSPLLFGLTSEFTRRPWMIHIEKCQTMRR